MYRGIPGRPDCRSPNPQFDGECPRLKERPHPVASRFLFLAGLFMKYNLPPIMGGQMDQDLRFITALGLLSSETLHREEMEMDKMLQKMKGNR